MTSSRAPATLRRPTRSSGGKAEGRRRHKTGPTFCYVRCYVRGYFPSSSRLGRTASIVVASFAVVIDGDTTVPNVSLSNHTHMDAV
jgi:hypothetical protein